MKTASSLHHVAYLSRATAPFGSAQLRMLLAGSRQRNAERGITGLLLCGNDQFFQVLEGEAPLVRQLYARICRDPRHCEVLTLADQAIERRRFAGWSMRHQSLPVQPFIEFAGYATQACQHPDAPQADAQLTQLLAQVLAT